MWPCLWSPVAVIFFIWWLVYILERFAASEMTFFISSSVCLPGDVRCPVNSFIHYMEHLNPNVDAFFQRPNKNKDKFDKMALGMDGMMGLLLWNITADADILSPWVFWSSHCTTAQCIACHRVKCRLKMHFVSSHVSLLCPDIQYNIKVQRTLCVAGLALFFVQGQE